MKGLVGILAAVGTSNPPILEFYIAQKRLWTDIEAHKY